MTRLRFHEILLLSTVEKSGRKVRFPKLVTVIKGENDRGKSCLIKSLYAAFGAVPRKIHPNWKKLKVSILVHFDIGGTFYRILNTGTQYTVFNAEGVVVGSYGSITKGLGPFLASLFDFHLELTNATSRESQQATPAFIFLPFYFDQDGSWIENWNSFELLSQFSHYRQAIAQFHTGIRPNEYYKAKTLKEAAEHRLEEVRAERGVVNRVLEKIELLMKDSQFDISARNYEEEITQLLQQCNGMKTAEEALRDELVVIDNHRASIERQIQITEQAATELGKDFTYAAEEAGDEIECPTCGAGYHNSFAERFGIAQDEDQMRSLLLQLNDEREKVFVDMQSKKDSADAISVKFRRISELLEVRQGEVALRDILQSEGKKEVRKVLRDDLAGLNQKIGELDAEVEEAVNEMKEHSKIKKAKEIKEYYLGRMASYLALLQVKELTEEGYKDVYSRIKENGSDGPRALLAFYFAILKTIEKYSTSTICPIVIDSPNQQDQDPENWKRMMEFMRDHRPSESQMILGLVNDAGVDMGGDVIELNDERQLLQKDQYDEVALEMRPFIDKSLAY